MVKLCWCKGLVDDFTILDNGREVLTMEADEGRACFRKIRARFAVAAPEVAFPEAKQVRREGRELELTVNGHAEEVLQRLRALAPEEITQEALTLEEIFVAMLK